MTKKIFRSTLLVAAVVLLSSLLLIMGVLYKYFDDVQISQLWDELRIAAAGTELRGDEFLSRLNAEDYRITWVAADGTVLYDTSANASAMENHAGREEIRQALQTGSGSDIRYSATLLERTVYEAVRLSDGSVLRISASQNTILILLVGMLQPLAVVTAVAIILSAILAGRMSKKIVQPLNSLDLEHPLENEAYEEITPLLRRINRQHNQITAQMQTLRQKADEFEQITAHMREGLVVLSSEGNIISINPTAGKLFGVGEDCVGKNLLTLDRSRELRETVNAALDSGRGKARIQKDGKVWKLDSSRIESDGTVLGAVLLAIDVTEAQNAEKTRREFSANVSHELKTPLQSIMGSAELLENGLVKPEDTPRFVGYIRKEAARLLHLIEDIIGLSQLDEGVELPKEPVELLALAAEAAETLEEAARRKGVSVEVSGDGFSVQGVRRILQEMVYNLCENAIKYNIEGGSVRILVEKNVLQVSDTGIGIPKEHQEQVFERFYRVDKSHSRASGGTGLGLSIVKHAAQLHGAKLKLHSVPGEGTTVTVTF